jgi:hypothetical protein
MDTRDDVMKKYRQILHKNATSMFQTLIFTYEMEEMGARALVLGEHASFLAYLASVMSPQDKMKFINLLGNTIMEFKGGEDGQIYL